MLYKFKNGVAEEWKDGKLIVPKGVDADTAMRLAGYEPYMDSDETIGELNPFSIVVFKSKHDPVRWIVHVWDENEYLEEYHVENSFDLATLINTFCAPLGKVRKIESE